MVSGIGPADTLNAKGIHVVEDRPGVGQNMWVSCHLHCICGRLSLYSCLKFIAANIHWRTM